MPFPRRSLVLVATADLDRRLALVRILGHARVCRHRADQAAHYLVGKVIERVGAVVRAFRQPMLHGRLDVERAQRVARRVGVRARRLGDDAGEAGRSVERPLTGGADDLARGVESVNGQFRQSLRKIAPRGRQRGAGLGRGERTGLAVGVRQVVRGAN
jgi:hypothetical protein